MSDMEFPFMLTDIEYQLTMNKGLQEMYKVYGKDIWKQATAEASDQRRGREVASSGLEESNYTGGRAESLAW